MANTVAQAFAATAAQNGELPFLIVPARSDREWLPAGVELSYAAVADAVAHLKARYAAAGYGPGHRVALLLENRPEFFLHYLALNGLGAGIVPVNPDYRHDEVTYVLAHSEAELAVVLSHRVADMGSAAATCGRPPAVVDALDLPAALPPPAASAHSGEPSLDTECALLYTSGTTGRPKGCMLSNFYFLTSGRTYCSLGGLIKLRHGRERFYNPLGIGYSAGITARRCPAGGYGANSGCSISCPRLPLCNRA